ncbi:MAG TPA: cytochrome P450 [Ktedonobacterales bacterium]
MSATKTTATATVTTPPHHSALPYLGDALAVFRNPLTYAQRHFQRFGPVWATTFRGKPTVVAVSAAAQRQIFDTNSANFLWHPGYGAMGDELFGDALFLLDGERHRFQRTMMTPAFHGKHYAGYLAAMNAAIDKQLATWGASGETDLYPQLRTIAFSLATNLLAGTDFGSSQPRMQALFTTMIAGATSLSHARLSWTRYGQALNARKQIEPVLTDLIQQRRDTPTNDALGLLVQARDEDGKQLSDDELIAQAITMVFAGHDSTSSTITWLLLELLRHPGLLDRVRSLVGSGDAPLTLETLKDPFLDALVKESLRLHPAAVVLMRGAVNDFTLLGSPNEDQEYRIAGGAQVLMLPVFVHHRPDYWENPETFDPDRFLPPRDEDARTPYAFVGFGAGKRSCIGSGIAQMEVKALLVKILRRFDLTLTPGQDTRPIYLPLSRPRTPVHITYTSR